MISKEWSDAIINYLSKPGYHIVKKTISKSVVIAAGAQVGSVTVLSAAQTLPMVITNVKTTMDTLTFSKSKVSKGRAKGNDVDIDDVYPELSADEALDIPVFVSENQASKYSVYSSDTNVADKTQTVDLTVLTLEQNA